MGFNSGFKGLILMKIRPVGAELFRADERADMTKLRTPPKKDKILRNKEDTSHIHLLTCSIAKNIPVSQYFKSHLLYSSTVLWRFIEMDFS